MRSGDEHLTHSQSSLFGLFVCLLVELGFFLLSLPSFFRGSIQFFTGIYNSMIVQQKIIEKMIFLFNTLFNDYLILVHQFKMTHFICRHNLCSFNQRKYGILYVFEAKHLISMPDCLSLFFRSHLVLYWPPPSLTEHTHTHKQSLLFQVACSSLDHFLSRVISRHH